MTDADEDRQRQQHGQRRNLRQRLCNLWGPIQIAATGSRITNFQHDSKSRTQLRTQSISSTHLVPWWSCTPRTLSTMVEEVWKGRGGRIRSGSGPGRGEESEQAGIHEPSTTATHRTPYEAHSRPNPTKCAESICTKVSGCHSNGEPTRG